MLMYHYSEVIQQERRGDYLGKTVQIVPHATDMIQSWIKDVAKRDVDGTGIEPDVCLIEVGGTVGDLESAVFLESLRQFQFSVGKENILFVHISLVPVLGSDLEQKTKPTQHSVKELRAIGLIPDIIVCRSAQLLSESTRNKISLFCHVTPSHVFTVHDVSNIYHVPLMLVEQQIHVMIKEKLNLKTMADTPNLSAWTHMANVIDARKETVEIALVGKYTQLTDSYLSVTKALQHSGTHCNVDVVIRWIEASDLEEDKSNSDPEKYTNAWKTLKSVQGILVPGGFGVRGIEGKLAACKYARENKVPYLGVCLGMQVMVIEYARNVLKRKKANSAEFDESTSDPVVMFMPEINQNIKGGTMRLGSRATHIQVALSPTECSLAAEVYGINPSSVNEETYNGLHTLAVNERHRHRYEVNPEYVNELEENGLVFSGKDDQNVRMEITELPRSTHPFFFGTQYHPEFKSRPIRPSPPFYAFVKVCGKMKDIGVAGELWLSFEDEIKKKQLEEQQRRAAKRNSSLTSPSRVGANSQEALSKKSKK